MSVVAAIPNPVLKTTLRVGGWSAVVGLGTVSIAVLAWSRGEPVSAWWVVVAALCVFAASYRFRSAWLMAKVFTLDELHATPAEIAALNRQSFSAHVNAAVTGVFLVLVVFVVVASARVWWQLLVGRRVAVLHAEPYVAVAVAADSQ